MRKASSRHRRGALAQLRLAVDCLPVRTREAMLAGVRASERIIAGAYVDGEGGVCPMLAAHRSGGRTDLLAFARSWDRFTGARGRPRRASAREVAILLTELEESLSRCEGLELDRAIAEHRALLAGRRARRSALLAAIDPRGEVRARRLRPSERKDAGDDLARRPVERPRWPVSAGVDEDRWS